MAAVTITGRINTVLLARGETVTVERTDRIDRLAQRGFITIEPQTSPESTQTHAGDTGAHTVDETDPSAHSDDESVDSDEPPRSGPGSHRDEWVRHLIDHDIDHDPTATKSDLIELWDTHVAGEQS